MSEEERKAPKDDSRLVELSTMKKTKDKLVEELLEKMMELKVVKNMSFVLQRLIMLGLNVQRKKSKKVSLTGQKEYCKFFENTDTLIGIN